MGLAQDEVRLAQAAWDEVGLAWGNLGLAREEQGNLAVAGSNVAGGGRPSTGQLNNFLDIPRLTSGAVGVGGGARPGAGGAPGDFLQLGAGATQLPAGPGIGRLPVAGGPGVGAPGVGRPGVGPGVVRRELVRGSGPGVGPGPASDRRQNLADNRPSRVENRQEWQGNRQQRRDEVRNQVAENHPRLDFWSDHPGWAAWRITRPYRWATWAAVTGWVGYGWSQPTAYSYGENVYYAGDQVYYGDQAVATADEYAQQAEAIAASAPETKPESGEWMPLGVFALTQDGQASGAEPTLFMQLAISKQGVIAGTLKNMATDQVQTLEGMADKKSQRVAWCVAGQKRPIMETGISNLTQDTSPALIHFADGQTQQWLLVRLPEPKQS